MSTWATASPAGRSTSASCRPDWPTARSAPPRWCGPRGWPRGLRRTPSPLSRPSSPRRRPCPRRPRRRRPPHLPARRRPNDRPPPPAPAPLGPPAPPRAAAPMTAAPPPPLPPPAAEPPPEHAIHQVTEQTRTYPCTNCGGQLEFDIDLQKLKCPNCGNVQDIIEDAGRVTAEQDFRAAVAKLHSEAAAAGPQVVGEKEVVCQNCGGHTTFTGTLTSTRCPYCATPIQRDDVHDAPARLPVDGVLPFRVDQRQAKEALEKWINGRWF